MFLKVGALSLILLLASRMLGLLRESVLAAAFGTSGAADAAIVMLTLPDWIAGVLASGALTLVLLPHWAQENPAQRDATQRRIATGLLVLSAVLLVGLWVARVQIGAILVPGVPSQFRHAIGDAVAWSALAVPAAMLAGLWGARLQHERDFVGLYSASLVVNLVVIAALFWIALRGTTSADGALLGFCVCLAAALRLVWQFMRLRRVESLAHSSKAPEAAQTPQIPQTPVCIGHRLPGGRVWVLAALAAGLPLTLPFVARSLASNAGEGALTLFNYAWKLVELPLILAVQLVTSLAFPAIARAHARPVGGQEGDERGVVRNALVLAWTLACAAAAALIFGAPVISALLFGWGQMQSQALDQIAVLGAVGAWGLLPQALIAVALTVLATLGRMRVVVISYAVALAALLAAGAMGLSDGEHLMWVLNGIFTAIALAAWLALGPAVCQPMPWRALLVPFLALAIVAWSASWSVSIPHGGMVNVKTGSGLVAGILGCGLVAIFVIASGWFSGPYLRQALRS